MEAMFYRGIDPADKGYAELRYWYSVHEKIVDAEIAATKVK